MSRNCLLVAENDGSLPSRGEPSGSRISRCHADQAKRRGPEPRTARTAESALSNSRLTSFSATNEGFRRTQGASQGPAATARAAARRRRACHPSRPWQRDAGPHATPPHPQTARPARRVRAAHPALRCASGTAMQSAVMRSKGEVGTFAPKTSHGRHATTRGQRAEMRGRRTGDARSGCACALERFLRIRQSKPMHRPPALSAQRAASAASGQATSSHLPTGAIPRAAPSLRITSNPDDSEHGPRASAQAKGRNRAPGTRGYATETTPLLRGERYRL